MGKVKPSGTDSGIVFRIKSTEYQSHKSLSAAYNVSAATLKRELKKIKGLKMFRYKKLYSPRELKIIFSHLGDPNE